jgi:hypothetical protein
MPSLMLFADVLLSLEEGIGQGARCLCLWLVFVVFALFTGHTGPLRWTLAFITPVLGWVGRWFGVGKKLRMFALKWRHAQEEQMIRSMRLLPAEEDALLLRAAVRFMEKANTILKKR